MKHVSGDGRRLSVLPVRAGLFSRASFWGHSGATFEEERLVIDGFFHKVCLLFSTSFHSLMHWIFFSESNGVIHDFIFCTPCKYSLETVMNVKYLLLPRPVESSQKCLPRSTFYLSINNKTRFKIKLCPFLNRAGSSYISSLNTLLCITYVIFSC